MEDTEWKYSNEIDNGFTQPEEGPQYLVIDVADYNDDDDTYALTMTSLSNQASVRLKYWLSKMNDDGEILPDAKQRRTLISLKKALYGPDANGIPNPADIVGCVVMANVALSPSKKDPTKSYPRVYTFEPVPTGIAEGFGKTGQYSIPEEDGEQTVETE